MTRTFVGRDLREWEAFATTARGGLPEPGRILFRCVSDPEMRTRGLEVDGSRALAEGRIEASSESDLVELLAEAEEIP